MEGVETPISTLYASSYSDSSLPILLLVLPQNKEGILLVATLM